MARTTRWLPILTIVIAAFAGRCMKLDQPIVENYVGRQIPTAMVARNLDRGSGFLRPQLDTGPFPNLFLVEPPIYEAVVVGLHRTTLRRLSLESCGRLVSAIAVGLGTLGLALLVVRRQGLEAALFAVIALSVFPVVLRFGRAFQPDALAMGLGVLGVAVYDRARPGGLGILKVVGLVLVALAVAQKAYSVFLLVPLATIAIGEHARWRRSLLLLALVAVPAVAWYGHAWRLLQEGSRASADNAAIWWTVLGGVVERPETLIQAGRLIGLTAFTPIGFLLAILGLWRRRSDRDRLWTWWALAALGVLLVLAAKLHHDYYALVLAPPAAAGVGCALASLSARPGVGRVAAIALTLGLGAAGFWQSRNTWQTPSEWVDLAVSGREIRRLTAADAWLVAREAVVYQADRKGCRLEYDSASINRAAGEWTISQEDKQLTTASELVEFYHDRGARYLAELPAPDDSPLADRQKELFDELRTRHRIVVDSPTLFLIELLPAKPETH